MKILLIVFLFMMISCAGTFQKTIQQEEPVAPQTCCIYQDGVTFIFCVDGKKFGIRITPIGIMFGGGPGECSCEDPGREANYIE